MLIYFGLLAWLVRQSLCLECSPAIIEICNLQTTCDQCIRQHPCCSFCYQKDYQFQRCSTEGNHTANLCQDIELNDITEAVVEKDVDFMDVTDFSGYSVQLKPQKLKYKLRKGEPQEITISYKPAKNNPVDLYYLMDLTISMAGLLDTMKHLGEDLSSLMKNLTKFHRFGFGSYVDKPAMPFYRTDSNHSQRPCDFCAPGYLFKHYLNFTDNSTKFTEKLNQARISANLDRPEGGMEVIMQLLFCQRELDWTLNSRKFIVLATDSPLHAAGDGILAGAVKRNTNKCLINDTGDISEPLLYDYPSFAELKQELRNKKTNIIIATKGGGTEYYREMKKLFPNELYVEELADNSTNVLQLIEKGYTSLVKKAIIEHKIPNLSEDERKKLDIKMYVDCRNTGVFEPGNSCENITEEKTINVKMEINVTDYMSVTGVSMLIGERNIKEEVAVDLEFVGARCECKNSKLTSKDMCKNGVYRCNSCLCNEGWIGETCSEECTSGVESCRHVDVNGTISTTCYGHGECICGHCECDFPYLGHPYCKYQCPVNELMVICSGHGLCVDNRCVCDEHYLRDDCSYSTDKTPCTFPGTGLLCSKHGECENAQCVCEEGYYGPHCEYCDESHCEQKDVGCEVYEGCVMAMLEESRNETTVDEVNCMAVYVESNEGLQCILKFKQNDTECDVYFTYPTTDDSFEIILYKECKGPSIFKSEATLAGVIIAIVIGMGIIALIVFKVGTTIIDRKEFAKFEAEAAKTQFSTGQNPIYNTPVREYENINLRKLN